MLLKHEHFSLSHFEGSLEVLLCLIQKEEIEIYDIPIQELIQQFLVQLNQECGIEKGAEFIGSAAYLIWLKSKALLPHDEQIVNEEEEAEDPHFEIIHHLVDYCRFKQAAKELTLLQAKQQGCYFRGINPPQWKKPLGIDHVSLEELSLLFKEMMSKAVQHQTSIQDEHWRVSDKIRCIRRQVQELSSFLFSDLFFGHQSRMEMIVIFLAILELMKMGEIEVVKKQALDSIWICEKEKMS